MTKSFIDDRRLFALRGYYLFSLALFIASPADNWLLTLFSGAVLASAAEPGTARATIEAPKLRKAAPAFTLFDVSGKAVRLSDYRGQSSTARLLGN